MALQGDLDSFALPDVLRLLAGTGKTGRLAVSAEAGTGEVWLQDGALVGGSASASPHADRPADVVFELLRVEGGSFVFDDGEQLVDAAERADVEDAIQAAEALVAEWAEVEAVVPTVHAGISLASELPGDDVTLSAKQWRLLASLRPASTVRTLGDQFELTDLAASRKVKALVEAGLVVLGEVRVRADEPDTFGLGGFVETDDVVAPADHATILEPVRDDLSILSAEDGPVVLETRDDALLPEPLPGEGTSFDGDLGGLGTVDGRTFESIEAEAAAAAPGYGDAVEVGDWQAHGDFDDHAVAEGRPEPVAPWGDAGLTGVPSAPPEPAPATDAAPAEPEDDRGSLLKFLSTVKP